MKLDQTVWTIGMAMLLTHTSPAWAQAGNQGALTGSAFAVQASGKLLTNNHVVADCSEVTVRSESGTPMIGRIIGRDAGNDLALIATESRLTSVAVFRRTPIDTGEDIIALGFPLPNLLAKDLHVSTGIVSARAGMLNDSAQLQISAEIQPGHSGGPVLDSFGSVAGVVVLRHEVFQNVNFAVKAEVARVFLRSQGVEPLFSSQTPLRHVAVPDAVKQARAYTFVVECDPSLPTAQQKAAAERAAAEAPLQP